MKELKIYIKAVDRTSVYFEEVIQDADQAIEHTLLINLKYLKTVLAASSSSDLILKVQTSSAHNPIVVEDVESRYRAVVMPMRL